MKTTNKEFQKSDRPLSGFYNVLLQRVYSKVDGIDVSKIDRVIEVVTISQLKDLSVDIKKYNISNTQGLAGRFENTRNYIFPVDAMSKLLSTEDHATFKANYDRACKELAKSIEAEKKENDPVRKAVMSVINAAVKTTEEKKPDPVKTAIADVIPLNATVKSEKAEKVQDSDSEKSEQKAPAKTEEKKQENKPVDPVVTKSVTIDAGYIDKLIAAAPVAKKSKAKKSIKKSDLEQIAALF